MEFGLLLNHMVGINMEQRLLEFRRVMKKKKPHFVRQQSQYVKSLEKKWRAPKGMHSKLRKKKRGKLKQPSMGYSSPAKVRYLHPSGLMPSLINNPKELIGLGRNYGVIVSYTVGKKKKVEILKKSKELDLQVLNVKNTGKYITNIEEKITRRKQERLKEMEKKGKKSKDIVKEKKVLNKEEKEIQEKEEKRKVLESRK